MRRIADIPWWGRILLVVGLESLALLALLPATWQGAVRGDGGGYYLYAYNLLHHGVFSMAASPPYYPGITRAPGYPTFLIPFIALFGHHAVVIRVAQLACIGLTAIVVRLTAAQFTDGRTADLAAILTATYLPLLGYTSAFLAAVVTTLLYTVAVWLTVLCCRAPSGRRFALLGLVIAAAAYVRPEAIGFGAVLLAGVALTRTSPWRPRRRGAAVLLTGALVACLVTPWIIRDASVTRGALVPMGGGGGVDLLLSADQYQGAMPDNPTNFTRYWSQIAAITTAAGVPSNQPSDAAQQWKQNTVVKQAANRIFASLSPGQILQALPQRLRYLWWTGDQAAPPQIRSLWALISQLQYVLLVVTAIAGGFLRRASLLRDWPLWIAAGFLTALHLYYSAAARYTLEARPMLMVFSAVGLVAGWRLIATRIPGRAPRPLEPSTSETI